jgi:hypothetical protein
MRSTKTIGRERALRNQILSSASLFTLALALMPNVSEAQTVPSQHQFVWDLDGGDGAAGLELCTTAAMDCPWNAVNISIPGFGGIASYAKFPGWGANGESLILNYSLPQILVIRSDGGNGNNGSNGDLFSDGTAGGFGGDGGGITLTLSEASAVRGIACFFSGCPGVFISANGGNGGQGGNSDTIGFGSGKNGGLGGRGGQIEITSTRDISTQSLLGYSQGILIQSNGGGGGDGGDGGAFSGGGDGAPTSDGGNISLTTSGNISTAGNTFVDGVIAQSIGGFGGDGGDARGLFGSGGSGGHAGSGGKISIENQGAITTDGLLSRGILAQSIGGGGGNGGDGAGFIALGGSGADGGDGGAVEVKQAEGASIITKGELSDGILAQSVGGGGGNGGLGTGIVAIGGSGGPGGNGSGVDVDNGGLIMTEGDDSRGIFAQSIGGGGGNGGGAVAAGLVFSLAIGGQGGPGGDGGAVVVNGRTNFDRSEIVTLGANAHGIQAQSVGGGGGDGGRAISVSIDPGVGAAIALGVGGDGATGGSGGVVQVSQRGAVSTSGDSAYGIFAQSVGGGGGNGGAAIAAAIGPAFSLAVALGGAGGAGGDGKTVTVGIEGNVSTSGTNAYGIFAQSVGGGGGNGGYAISGGVGTVVGAFGLGGTGGDGGVGGDVSVRYAPRPEVLGTPLDGALRTLGDGATGIFAQSVGGGGGNGGLAGGIGVGAGSLVFTLGGIGGMGTQSGSVVVNNQYAITTEGEDATGIIAQSIGGGGGNGGGALSGTGGAVAVSIAVGGAGGQGSSASNVTVDNTGAVTTQGAFSHGLFSQAVGGGGGNGGFAVAGSLGLSIGPGPGVAGSISIGGRGGSGGRGGKVITTNSGDITVMGAAAQGIFAQSIGGGGGNGGVAGALAAGAQAAIGISVGGGGGNGGWSRPVDVINTANVSTGGAASNAIFAQSVGGGGGNGGNALSIVATSNSSSVSGSVAIGGKAGTGNSAGEVLVDHAGILQTVGAQSNGILAQSIGGGGGNGGFAIAGNLNFSGGVGVSVGLGGKGGSGSNGTLVTVRSNVNASLTDNIATIATAGGDANGIFAQSVGGGGGNGGFSGAFSFTAGTSASANAKVAIGGKGGGGGSGGDVDILSNDNILTQGEGANGVFAQSVGGGGGNGGFSAAGALKLGAGKSANIGVSIGGEGGQGAQAGIVNAVLNGAIQTQGDNASGVFAQSIGGGGGNGGMAVAADINLSSGKSAKMTVAIGGAGGDGSVGGDVFLIRTGSTSTAGEKSYGLFAQSIGGGGGNGGLSLSGSLSGKASKNINVSIGGEGGGGSVGGAVTVSQGEGAILTEGSQAHAILAQSIGGGGGNGGFAASGIFSLAGGKGTSNVNLGVTVGGDGGAGGIGGNVSVGTDASIETRGDAAAGVFAQSVGGGGGSGGGTFNTLQALNGGAEGRVVNVAIAVGGDGGSGNLGGNVDVFQTGSITTRGDGAAGIHAQSVGGGGGVGGTARALSLVLGIICDKATGCSKDDPKKKNNLSLEFGIGGKGGAGNDGGEVRVDNQDAITTFGIASYGIFAQSIGAGGGSGGDVILGLRSVLPKDIAFVGKKVFKPLMQLSSAKRFAFGVGGSGGASGDGNLVDITNAGVILTSGDFASGIFAQSVGGGGGSGGKGQVGRSGRVGIGGNGGASGNGGIVNVENAVSGSIRTEGDFLASAIFAQSVGGGGGQGGSGSGQLNIGGFRDIGSGGGVAGDGGKVTVENAGTIETVGALSAGVAAQSVGGGGGAGGGGKLSLLLIGGDGGSAGNGGGVDILNAGSVLTEGVFSAGLLAQSVGGGGGLGGGEKPTLPDVDLDDPNFDDFTTDEFQQLLRVNLIAKVGGGGSGGDGGSVNLENSGFIETVGGASAGVFAQSVGGGGGAAGEGMSAVTIGSDGGASGNGGLVEIENRDLGVIVTRGNGSVGMFAQSVGGGGGSSGETDGIATFSSNGSGGGDGGMILLNNAAGILTFGDNSAGLLAQSVGGGGGFVGGASGLLFEGDANDGGAGNGGDIALSNSGDIFTAGADSTGIFAQSVGGGGGLVYGSAGAGDGLLFAGTSGGEGEGGDITIVHTAGAILTSGVRSNGIFAQSLGADANGNIQVTIGAPSVVMVGLQKENTITNSASLQTREDALAIIQGGAGGAGVVFSGGNNNVLFNYGEISTIDGLSGTAILGGDGSERITNAGTIIGNIFLGGGANSFTNTASGRVSAGSIVDLGSVFSTLINDGVMEASLAGARSTIGVSMVNGGFQQTSLGTLFTDFDFIGGVGTADRIDVTGFADLKGSLFLNVLNKEKAAPGSGEVTVFSSSLGIGEKALNFIAPQTAVAKFSMSYIDNSSVKVSYEINYLPDDPDSPDDRLNMNEQKIGNYINNIQTNGGVDDLAPLINAIFDAPTLGDLKSYYDTLNPDGPSANVALSLLSIDSFLSDLAGCGASMGQKRRNQDGSVCFWADISGRYAKYEKSFDFDDYKERSIKFVTGLERSVAERWVVGIGGAYEKADSKAAGGSFDSDGRRVHGGLYTARRTPSSSISAQFLLGRGAFETQRAAFVGGLGGVAIAAPDLSWVGGAVGGSRNFRFGPISVSPSAKFDFVKLNQHVSREFGAGMLDLIVSERADFYAKVTPSVEFAAESGYFRHGFKYAGSIKVGVSQNLTSKMPTVNSTLAAAAYLEYAPCCSMAGRDDTLVNLEGAFSLLTKAGVTISLQGRSRLGRETSVYEGSARAQFNF